MIFPQESKTE